MVFIEELNVALGIDFHLLLVLVHDDLDVLGFWVLDSHEMKRKIELFVSCDWRLLLRDCGSILR